MPALLHDVAFCGFNLLFLSERIRGENPKKEERNIQSSTYDSRKFYPKKIIMIFRAVLIAKLEYLLLFSLCMYL